MLIKQKKYFLAICAFLMVCLVAGSSSTSLRGDVKRYEVRPEITVPEYKTDIARIVDAYERLMDNYITLTENNLATTRTEIGDITKKLDTIDQKITDLSNQLETIQKNLGIETLQKPLKTSNNLDEAASTDQN